MACMLLVTGLGEPRHEASLGKYATAGTLDFQYTTSWTRQANASIGKYKLLGDDGESLFPC